MFFVVILQLFLACTFAEFCSVGPLEPYLVKARWICQSIHSFLDIMRVFYTGVPDAAQEDEQVDVDECAQTLFEFLFF